MSGYLTVSLISLATAAGPDLHLRASFGENIVSRQEGSAEHEYPGMDISAAWEFLKFEWNGSLELAVGYDRLFGDELVLGSYRNLIYAKGGYQQRFPLTSEFGLLAAVNIGGGWGNNHLNFGEGRVPLPREQGLSLIAGGRLGVGYCLGTAPCIEAFAAPSFEVGALGDPKYLGRSLLWFGIGVGLDLSPSVGSVEHRDTVEKLRFAESERDRLASESQALRKKFDELDRTKAAPIPTTQTIVPAEPRDAAASPAIEVINQLAKNPIEATVVLFANESGRVGLDQNYVLKQLTDHMNPQLEIVVEYLLRHRSTKMRIHGHANSRGAKTDNLLVSQTRARAVAAYLRSRGVPAEQIIDVIGHGADKPLDPQNPSSPLNRAVTFEEVES